MQDIIPPNLGFNKPNESLKLVSFCPVCREKYNPFEAKVIEENNSAHLLHVKCSNCQAAILALIMTSGMGVSSVGLVTDLNGNEIRRFIGGKKVDSDDVLSLYSLIKEDNFEKDFLNA
jgi:hypothetical protein